ncbi:MAG: nitroreductase family protein, partial [Planctomycetota bacterium]
SKNFGCDHGIAAQSMLLGAAEKGLGGCMIGSVKRKELCMDLDIPSHFELLLVIALGKPREKVVVDTMAPGGDVKYWRDDQGVHHVPKRPLHELIVDPE